ncbi:MAG: hypothetical protein NTV25_07635 [Methanothrix sp.]|nr:hypothetical protein [Methanothrix sp.]
MHPRTGLLILFLMLIFSLPAQCTQPEIQLTETREGNNLTVLADIADPNGLASATLYILEKKSGDVVWTEQRILQGSKVSVSFRWPWRTWRISNGTHLIEPALVVKTIDPSAEEAPYLVYSAPCLLNISPGWPPIATTAYFDEEGQFHSLRDLSGNEFYKSRELLRAVSPETSYGRYVQDNISLSVGRSSLRFLLLNQDTGLNPFPALVLERSPIQHYTLTLEGRTASPGPYIVGIEASSAAGNKAAKFFELPL